MIKKYLNKKESGEIFIEATMVLVVAMIVLCIMIGLGFYIYQKCMLATVTTETANYAANNYKYTKLSAINTDNVPNDKIANLDKFRSFRNLLNETKITKYAQKRARKTSFTSDAVSIKEIKLIRNGIGRQRIKLTLKMKTSIVFENILVSLGVIKSNPSITHTAYSECLDLTEYSSQVFFVKYIQNGIQGSNIGTSMDNIGSTITKVKKIIGQISK